MKTLKELSHDSFYNMQNYSQITIDYIQELEMILDFYEEEKNLSLIHI
jgi:hypothetical protein